MNSEHGILVSFWIYRLVWPYYYPCQKTSYSFLSAFDKAFRKRQYEKRHMKERVRRKTLKDLWVVLTRNEIIYQKDITEMHKPITSLFRLQRRFSRTAIYVIIAGRFKHGLTLTFGVFERALIHYLSFEPVIIKIRSSV